MANLIEPRDASIDRERELIINRRANVLVTITSADFLAPIPHSARYPRLASRREMRGNLASSSQRIIVATE